MSNLEKIAVLVEGAEIGLMWIGIAFMAYCIHRITKMAQGVYYGSSKGITYDNTGILQIL